MPTLASKPAASTVEDRAILTWTVHLARTQPAKAVASVAFICAATALGCILVGPFIAALVAAALIASLSDFLFPLRYIITREKAACRTIGKGTEIKWANVKRCYLDDCGVKLSPLDRVSRLEAFRGVYLRFADNEDEVVEAVKSLRPSDV
jgi:hypothetical protein